MREEQRRVQDASCSRSIMAAPKGPGIQPLMDAVTGLFQPIGEQGRRPMRQRFQGGVYRLRPAACLSTAIQRNARLRIRWPWPGEKLKITEMRIPSKGEIVRTDTAYPGEIVILADDTLKLNDILGNENSCLIKHGLIIPCHYFGQR